MWCPDVRSPDDRRTAYFSPDVFPVSGLSGALNRALDPDLPYAFWSLRCDDSAVGPAAPQAGGGAGAGGTKRLMRRLAPLFAHTSDRLCGTGRVPPGPAELDLEAAIACPCTGAALFGLSVGTYGGSACFATCVPGFVACYLLGEAVRCLAVLPKLPVAAADALWDGGQWALRSCSRRVCDGGAAGAGDAGGPGAEAADA